MQVTGFSFVKDAIIYGYPVEASIRSILPLCDSFIVAVGKSQDATLDLIQSIDPNKIIVIETIWDESLRVGGKVLAQETNKALAAVPANSDWAFYLQADEVVHEKYLDIIYQAMLRYKDDTRIEGLLFHYLHFFGSYEYVANSPNWYDKEVRIIRPCSQIYSYKDAQGFRKGNNQKLKVKLIDAYIYHYGWVKDPVLMQKKQRNFNKYWHEDEWIEKNIGNSAVYEYEKNIQSLAKFDGTHPAVMQPFIQNQNWHFEFDISKSKLTLKQKIKRNIKKYLGIDLGYKNYKILT
ncbi:MAG: glycosyltransferase family 2 protein [Bacteroidia bacterium]|nr:glycosyltransferase family 2 protein [Bacteroidia bacterium]MDW8157957.1 glycosyltransferase family 2 protein [Bacteroidia bacterium]